MSEILFYEESFEFFRCTHVFILVFERHTRPAIFLDLVQAMSIFAFAAFTRCRYCLRISAFLVCVVRLSVGRDPTPLYKPREACVRPIGVYGSYLKEE
jgi:hypothetical protein